MGVMDDRSSRVFVGVCLLVLLWIGTYWVYDPGRPSGAAISFAQAPEAADPSADRSGDPSGGGAADPGAPDRAGGEPRPSASPGATADQAPGPVTPDPSRRVIPPVFETVTIGPGDTFESIARRRWGDAALGSVIARANPLKDPTRLRVGETLRVPIDPTNIQGRLVDGRGQPAEPDRSPTDQDGWAEYTVQPGDALSKIARWYYGTARYADVIFEANRDQLSSPDALRVGQLLRLPPPSQDPG